MNDTDQTHVPRSKAFDDLFDLGFWSFAGTVVTAVFVFAAAVLDAPPAAWALVLAFGMWPAVLLVGTLAAAAVLAVMSDGSRVRRPAARPKPSTPTVSTPKRRTQKPSRRRRGPSGWEIKRASVFRDRPQRSVEPPPERDEHDESERVNDAGSPWLVELGMEGPEWMPRAPHSEPLYKPERHPDAAAGLDWIHDREQGE